MRWSVRMPFRHRRIFKMRIQQLEESIRLAREFARGLQTVELKPDGLMDGFQELARNTSERFQISCEFECREPVRRNLASSFYARANRLRIKPGLASAWGLVFGLSEFAYQCAGFVLVCAV